MREGARQHSDASFFFLLLLPFPVLPTRAGQAEPWRRLTQEGVKEAQSISLVRQAVQGGSLGVKLHPPILATATPCSCVVPRRATTGFLCFCCISFMVLHLFLISNVYSSLLVTLMYFQCSSRNSVPASLPLQLEHRST